MTSQEVRHPFIGGEACIVADPDTFVSINPATEEISATYVQCGQQQVDDAVAAGTAAQREWLRLPPSERATRIWRWGELIVANADELALLDTIDIGKPLAESKTLLAPAGKLCRYWAGMADKIWGNVMPVNPGHLSYTQREPLGVIGVIIPWNIPVSSFVGRVAASLSCGNAVVVKPSEYSPASALRLAALTVEAGIPRGLVNVVTGDGAVGELISRHPGVGGIAFTGSVASGRKVNVAAAETFKQVILEMGGKSPNIVFADADLDAALRGSVWGVFYNTGQICGASTRLLVQRSVAGEFVERLKVLTAKVRVGDPLDRTTHIGPIVSERQFARVNEYIEVGKHEAHLEMGGDDAPHATTKGYYVAPTIFTEATSQMRISQEEIFGPVLTVLTFEDEDEARHLANDVEYGLGATIWTRDGGRLLRLANQIDAGVIWGNTARLSDPSLTFGGFKNSGLGGASGAGAVEAFTRWKRFSIKYDESVASPGWDL